MAPRPFGHVTQSQAVERDLRTEMKARRAELNAKYRAEQARQNMRWELQQLFKKQDARIESKWRGVFARVNAAKWGTEGDGFFVITAKGTTQVSMPIRRPYREQE